MEAQVLTPLNALETNLNSLVTSLTQTNTYATAPQIAQTLLDTDDDLTASLNLLQRHQQNYARIIDLRAEVANLQDQLKSTIRQCVTLRDEIGQINPSILNSDSDEDEEEEGDAKVAEVDYRTLLTFGARIGKHNALAAREAEAESIRLRIASKLAASTAPVVNGAQSQDQEASAVVGRNGTDETNAEIERINNTIAMTRAQMGMAFPDAGVLRVGELGKLQSFRERQALAHSSTGDDEDAVDKAVDKEVERLVRETEEVAEATVADEEVAEDHDINMGSSPTMIRGGTANQSQTQSQPGQQTTGRPSQSRPSQQPALPKRKLDLDFPSSDEDDD